MRFSLSRKLLVANILVVLGLVLCLLLLSYHANKTLLSRAMNGIDEEVVALMAEHLSLHFQKTGHFKAFIEHKNEWNQLADGYFFKVFLKLAKTVDFKLAPPPENAIKTPAPPPCDPPFGTFLQRLSLLDAQKNTLIKADIQKSDVYLYPIRLQGQTLGWLSVGKINMDLLPLSEHFFKEQLRFTVLASVISALVAIIITFFLSKHITAPLQKVTAASRSLSNRQFDIEVNINTRDELQDLAGAFNSIARQFKNYESQRHDWLMNISHELRTPLTILLGEISALVDGVTPFNTQSLDSLRDEIVHINRLVDDLLSITQMQLPEFSVESNELDLNQLIYNQIETYQEQFTAQALPVNFIHPEHPTYVMGDALRLSQVMRNIFDNTLRYTARPGCLTIELKSTQTHCTLSFEDSGPGVPEDKLNHLFDRLFRLEISRNRATGGAGLGLNICKLIVEAHRGVIQAHNSPKGGLVIVISLPRAP